MWRITATAENSDTDLNFLFDSTTDPAQSLVCFAPLSVTMNKNVDKLTASAGQTLAYTLTFTNSGQRDATGATVVDTLPGGVTFTNATLNGIAATPLGGTCTAGTPCTFDVRTSNSPTPWPPSPLGSGGVLTGGQTGTLVINVSINNPLAAGITTLTNEAQLLTANTDPVVATATTDITHTPAPDVFLQKAADNTLLNPGDTVTYTITAVNAGDAAAGNVQVCDALPTDTYFTYVSGSISGGNSQSVDLSGCNGAGAGSPTLHWTITSLASGGSSALTFQMLVAASGVPAGLTYKNNFATATEATTTPSNSNTVVVAISTNANIALTKAVASPAYSASAGTGNGSAKSFSTTLTNTPVQAGSVLVFVSGTQAGTDSGTGSIIGNSLTGSTINYSTGALSLTFVTAPSNSAQVTVTYLKELAYGATVQYLMTVTSNGGGSATGVVVSDPIPSKGNYVAGSLLYDGSAQTDAQDGDSAYYDPIGNQVVFNPGIMTIGPDTAHTLKFSVLFDGSFGDGSTTVTNTATAKATNTASLSSSAYAVVTTKPILKVSKEAPPVVAYPLASLSANAAIGATTFTLTSPPGTQYFNAGDRIYVPTTPGQVLNVTAVDSPGINQITFTPALTVAAGSGTNVIPVIKYSINYENTGTASATSVRIKDILPANLNYLSATPAPSTAPTFDTNGYIIWDLGTLAPGTVGSILIYTHPTAVGTYSNTATISSPIVPEFASNTVVTKAGGLLVRKTTSTANVVNNPNDNSPALPPNSTPERGTYTISLTPQANVSMAGVTFKVTDYLPGNFTFRSGSSIFTNGTCTGLPTAGSKIAVWTGCSYTGAVPAAFTIQFSVDIAATVPAGTYQNPVTVEVTAGTLAIMPFDELNTSAEDVRVTIPGDISITKAIVSGPLSCNEGTCVDYRITARNLGTTPATNISVKDTDTDSTAWPPANLTYVSSTPGSGTFTSGTGIWSITGPVAAGASVTLDIRFSISSLTTTINNCATNTASTPADTNPGNDKYCVSLIPTLVKLIDFRAYEKGGQVYVRWETATERNTLGFNLLRLDPATGQYQAVNSGLMPAMFKPHQGGIYTLRDSNAYAGGSYTYKLMEVETTGGRLSYGPFTVSIESDSSAGELIVQPSSDYDRRENLPKEYQKARMEARKAALTAVRAGTKAFSGDRLKVSVTENGLYYIDAKDISTLLGLSLDKVSAMIGLGQLSLSTQGKQAAYLPATANAGLYFYGTGIDSLYTKENIYWLAKGQGKRMTVLGGAGPQPSSEEESFTETRHLEEDLSPWEALFNDPDADYWFWAQLFASSFWTDPPMDFTFEAPGLSASQNTAALKLRLFGGSDAGVANDHHVKVKVNGALVAEEWWSGLTPYTINVTAPINPEGKHSYDRGDRGPGRFLEFNLY